jgi:hypothetical protein
MTSLLPPVPLTAFAPPFFARRVPTLRPIAPGIYVNNQLFELNTT